MKKYLYHPLDVYTTNFRSISRELIKEFFPIFRKASKWLKYNYTTTLLVLH